MTNQPAFAPAGLIAPVTDNGDGWCAADEVRRLNAELELANRDLRRGIAERERMQAALIGTLQSLSVGVLAVGQDGIVIAANPAACEMFGREVGDLATRNIESALPETSEAHELLRTLQGAGGAQRRVVWRSTTADGPRQIELTAVRALPPWDTHLAGVVVLEDVTRMRRLEQQAQLKSRLSGMGEVAMNLAHEIRNPLGSIELFATTLMHDLKDDGQRQLARQIVHGVRALEHLVSSTLEFARPRRLTLERIDLRDVVRDTLVFISHPAREKRIDIGFPHDLTPEAFVAGDAEQLRQVLLNLFLNAIQAMDEGGRLTIEIEPTEGGWRVCVSDDGIGIPEELQERIFDPFFTTREKGSGIGLAIVHSIVSAMNGRIEVESRVCAGSTFRVYLPSHLAMEDEA